MKFIKTFDGRYINIEPIKELCVIRDVRQQSIIYTAVAKTKDQYSTSYELAEFTEKAEAQAYLDNLVAELNSDGQVKSNQPLADKIADARILLDSAYVDARALGNDTLYYLDNALNAVDELLNYLK